MFDKKKNSFKFSRFYVCGVLPFHWICFMCVIQIGYLPPVSSTIQTANILGRLGNQAIANATSSQRGEFMEHRANPFTLGLNGINEHSNIVKPLRNKTNLGHDETEIRTGNNGSTK